MGDRRRSRERSSSSKVMKREPVEFINDSRSRRPRSTERPYAHRHTGSSPESKGRRRRSDRSRSRERERRAHKSDNHSPDVKKMGQSPSDTKQFNRERAQEAFAPPLAQEKQQPNFELSGKLHEETNTFRGVVIKYSEPPEAMKPKIRWRFYPFKGESALPLLHLHRQSAYLIGKDRLICDMPVDHPSCSKQHAVLQFRLVPYTRPDGTRGQHVRPYIIDLESTNGTYLNSQRIEPRRYVELKEKDVLKFGYSSREYVLLHERSDTSAVQNEVDDDQESPEDD